MKRPVLILGWISRIVLPIARSLHNHGIPVDLADCVEAPRIAARSRAIRQFVRIPYPDRSPDAFVSELRKFVGQHGHDMLIPTDDLGLVALMDCYDDFKDLVQIACPPPFVTRLVLDKSCTLQIAQQCGIRVPKTAVVDNSSQLFERVHEFPFPWILKPVSKQKQLEEFKSCKLTTADELGLLFPTSRDFKPPMLVQEYCPGAGVGVEMLIHNGECIAVFQHRRLKELPHTGGVSVTAIAESPDHVLVEQSLALLRALKWEGVAMVEFKIDPADEQATFMEVNGRYWGTISLPISTGVDFPLYYWQLQHGDLPNVCRTYAAGTEWRWTVGRLDRLYRLLAEARISNAARRPLRQDLLSLVGDFHPFTHDAIFQLSDPLPAMMEFARAVHYFTRHSLQVMRGTLPATIA